MKAVFYNNEEFEEILEQIENLMQEAEDSPIKQTKELVDTILQYFDLLHREPLARLLKMIESNHPTLRSKMETDYTIKTLFALYDLIEVNIEKSPLRNKNTVGFVSVDDVRLLSMDSRYKKTNGKL